MIQEDKDNVKIIQILEFIIKSLVNLKNFSRVVVLNLLNMLCNISGKDRESINLLVEQKNGLNCLFKLLQRKDEEIIEKSL